MHPMLRLLFDNFQLSSFKTFSPIFGPPQNVLLLKRVGGLTFEEAFSFHGDPFPLKMTSNGKLAPLDADGNTSVTWAKRICSSGFAIYMNTQITLVLPFLKFLMFKYSISQLI